MEIQTYKNIVDWKSGNKLMADKIVLKEDAHELDLLHLSIHLILIDDRGGICCRKRPVDDFRYAGLWTTTIGTHVLLKQNYAQTLIPLLPVKMDIEWFGEFRVHDEWENEINGLYIGSINQVNLPIEFMSDRTFLSKKDLEKEITQSQTTPHLAGAYKLLTR